MSDKTYEVSEREYKILASAEQKARENGECFLRFAERDDGGVTVTEETEHVKELENQVNG